ncbi:MAG: hypothetical protein ACRDH2_20305, partial [Anaerolineales bacterium]
LEGQGLVASLAAALFGSALGFLFYNFAPAVSFMGDAGSLVLGFLLAVLGIKIKFIHFPLGSTWMAPIVVLGMLIFDTTLVSLSRARRGRSIFQGGSDHTSHRLVQLGMSAPRAVLTLYVGAAALGALAVFLTRAPVLVANVAFGILVLIGLVALLVFERIEPKLAGDPPLVLIPGGGGFNEAMCAALAVSRNVTVLLAPRQMGAEVSPARAEVVEIVAALAEDPDAVRRVLARGLGEAWWEELNGLDRALRLSGIALSVFNRPVEIAPHSNLNPAGDLLPQALSAIRNARLILLGPGDSQVNLLPALASTGLRAALAEAGRKCLFVKTGESAEALDEWLDAKPDVTSLQTLPQAIQTRLLAQAAARAKT